MWKIRHIALVPIDPVGITSRLNNCFSSQIQENLIYLTNSVFKISQMRGIPTNACLDRDCFPTFSRDVAWF